MKLIMLLARRAPKWLVAGSIILISLTVFSLWWMIRKSARTSVTAHPAQILKVQIDPRDLKDLVLSGNTLINFRTGEVAVKEWIEGFQQTSPPITNIVIEQGVVLVAGRGAPRIFGLDGRPQPQPNRSGEPVLFMALNSESAEVAYIVEGDLWKGKIDWNSSQISNEVKVTSTGHFREADLQHAWLWVSKRLYIHVLGKPHVVSLETGEVKPVSVSIERMLAGVGPNRKLMATGLASGQFAVVESPSGEAKQFRTLGDVKRVCWLAPERVAVLGGYRQVSVYDHTSGTLSSDFRTDFQLQDLTSPSPDGMHVFAPTLRGVHLLNVETGKCVPVEHSVMSAVWVSNDSFLCSNSAIDTSVRGVWLVGLDGRKEHLLGTPFDPSNDRFRSQAAVTTPAGVIFVSGGNLWSFDKGSREIRQLTHDLSLPPTLKLLSGK